MLIFHFSCSKHKHVAPYINSLRCCILQATFFMTYVLTSGWASLACELIQPCPLLCNLFYRFILQNKDDSSYGTFTFPYHTEVPRVLLFGLLGFTCSTLAPLILPFLLVYFFLAYLVYRNQVRTLTKRSFKYCVRWVAFMLI